MPELYHTYRPRLFKQLVGQDEAVKTLNGFLKNNNVPRAMLIHGISGTGKTTIARIMQRKLGCGDEDFAEHNCAKERGIDFIRDISQRVPLAPMSGKCRIWLLDEFHRATMDCQSSTLKMLEDVPYHVYFMLATTDPDKILKAIRTRCTHVETKPVGADDMKAFVLDIAGKEKIELTEAVTDSIVECADGSPRMALNLLNKIMGIEEEKDRLALLIPPEVKKKSIDLCRALLDCARWPKIAAILKTMDGEEPEQLRQAILGYAGATMMKASGNLSTCRRAALILDCFKNPFYQNGKALLCFAAWEVSDQK